MTTRFILRALAAPSTDADAVVRALQDCPRVQLLDRSARMLLVSGERADVEQALQQFAGWQLMPETTTPRPSPLPRPRRRP